MQGAGAGLRPKYDLVSQTKLTRFKGGAQVGPPPSSLTQITSLISSSLWKASLHEVLNI